jgi:hypothetical protein
VVVSADVSPTERKPAFFSVIAASVLNGSRVERAKAAEPRHHHHVAGGKFRSAGARHDWLRLRNRNSTLQKTAHPQLLTAWMSG